MEKISEKLIEIANQLGVTIEQLWPHFVQRAYVDGWVTLVYSIFWFSVFPIACFIIYKLYKASDADKLEFGPTVGVGILLTILFFICMGTGWGNMDSTITHITNPETWALRDLRFALTGK